MCSPLERSAVIRNNNHVKRWPKLENLNMVVKNTFKHKEVTQDYFPNSRTHSYPEAWGLSQLQIHHEYGKIQCCERLSAVPTPPKTNQKGEKEKKKSIHRNPPAFPHFSLFHLRWRERRCIIAQFLQVVQVSVASKEVLSSAAAGARRGERWWLRGWQNE